MDYPVNFAYQLSQHLKAFRKSRDLTQTQLAAQLGVTQSRIADIENNPGKVSLENLLKILSAMDVRIVLRDIAVNAPTEDETASAIKKPKTLAELKAMQDWPKLSGEDW